MKLIFFSITFLFLITIISAQPIYSQGCGMYYGNYGLGIMLLSYLAFILFIGLMISGIYWLIKSSNRL